MSKSIVIGGCVKLPDGRVGRVREKAQSKYKVRVRRKTSTSHQFLFFDARQLIAVDPPKGWMSVEGYNRYLKKTLDAAKKCKAARKVLRFYLAATPPFRLDLTVWSLRRRERNNLDYWDENQYIRVFVFENIAVKVQVKQVAMEPKVLVIATSELPIARLKTRLSHLLNQVLGLKMHLDWFYDLAKEEKILYPLLVKFKGVKPPRFPSLFEALVNAISCQQLSLEAALTIENKFVQHYGMPFKEANQIYYAFPEPCDIIKRSCEDLMKLGFSRQKGDTLIQLATKICSNDKAFADIENKSNEEIIQLLTSFKGIGLWSAEYILLRGLGRLEVIPGDDVAVQKNIQKIFNLRKRSGYREVKEIEKKWFPYAGLVYFHFLLQKLSESSKIAFL